MLSLSDSPFGQGAVRLSGAEAAAALLLAQRSQAVARELSPALLLSSVSEPVYSAALPPEPPVAPSRPPIRACIHPTRLQLRRNRTPDLVQDHSRGIHARS